MIKKRVLGGILSAAMLATAMPVSAAFSDVEGVESVAWAEPYINEMAELGYIKGYEDGTFKPNKTITKTEALLLLSRMIGVDDEAYVDSVEDAVEIYEEALSGYNTNYPREISFLLYTGVLKVDELDEYISSSNKNVPLKRYEAAIILTKLLGAEKEVQNSVFVSSSYADTVEIPDVARAYVEYVKEAGIMQGMGNNEEGQPMFSPNTGVTRSQMAKMLCTLIDVLKLSVVDATFVSVDDFEGEITVNIEDEKTVKALSDNARFKIDGKDVDMSDMYEGMKVRVTTLNGKVTLVENYVVIEDAVIKGLVSTTRDTSGVKTVVLVDANDKANVQTYTLAQDAKIRVNGAIDTFSKIKANNYVSVTISGGVVTELEVIDKESSASGTLKEIGFNNEKTLLKVEDAYGIVETYEVATEGVQVSRNSLSTSIAELMEGDSVNLKMTYGKVTKILATSKNQTNSGTISFITFSTKGTRIGIDVNGTVKEYSVNKSAEVLIDSLEGSVYDLRPGTDIDIKLQSAEIVKIEAAGKVARPQITGTIKSLNTTYGLIVIEENGVEHDIFVTGNTKIVDSLTGQNLVLKNIEKGRVATFTGSNSSGVFEATVVVLQ